MKLETNSKRDKQIICKHMFAYRHVTYLKGNQSMTV